MKMKYFGLTETRVFFIFIGYLKTGGGGVRAPPEPPHPPLTNLLFKRNKESQSRQL